MVIDSRRSRVLLAALLLAAAALFVMGTSIERSIHSEPVSTVSGEGQAAHVEGSTSEGSSAQTSEKENVFGIDIEGAPFVTIGVLISIGLAAFSLRSKRTVLFLVVVLFALAFAALDTKELLHQVHESRVGFAALAGVIGLLHLGAATLAGREGRAVQGA